ncbi:MAG: hypothetical protein ACXWJ4_01555, partial [Methyloceanibacter sp.]
QLDVGAETKTDVGIQPAPLFCYSIASSVCGASPGAEAAKSPAMTACSGQWDTMKKADRLPKDQTWAQFWSQCSKDFAAKKGTDATAAKSDTSQKASDTTPKEPKIKKKKVAVDESDSPGSSQAKRDCDAKWGQNKASTGAHGWHDYSSSWPAACRLRRCLILFRQARGRSLAPPHCSRFSSERPSV